MEGTVDLMTAFCTNEPLATAREGKPAVTFLPYDYGIETSAEALFTTDKYLAKNPNVVAGMVRAIRRGWEYALTNKEEAVNIVLKYGGKELDFDQQLQQLEAQVSFILTPDAEEHGIGYMTEARWQTAEDVLREQGILETDVDINEVFTLQFIEK
jgi:NitT/TauT family transport system substrate-binding protein